jgi:hypothetical protein
MEKRPAWKQPQALVLIAGGGIIALGTLYLLVSTWGAPAPTESAPPTARVLVDENALVAANAEPKGGTDTPNAATAVPQPTATEASSESKPDTERFNPNEIIADAQRSLDEAREQADQAQEQVEDELDKPEPDGPK